ncbi:MAG: amidohydrolase family protein [Acidobacteriota bacterium]
MKNPNPIHFCWSTWIAVLLISLISTVPMSAGQTPAADVDQLVPDYSQYHEADFLKVSVGTLKVKAMGERGWYVIVQIPARGARSEVKLTMPGQKVIRMVGIRGAVFPRTTQGDTATLTIPPDGIGWFFLYAPFPEVSVYDYLPGTLFKLKDSTPRRAKFPVVDVHVHLGNSTPEERVRVMDEVGVAIVIDSPLGVETSESHHRFEEKYPNRFLTLSCIDFENRFADSFPRDIIAKLESEVKTLGTIGISEVIDKGSGLGGHVLWPEPRGKIFVDDERPLELWRAAARLKLPLMLHVAEPIWFFQRLDRNHEFLGYEARRFWWNLAGTDTVGHEEMIRRRDHILAAVPDLIMIGAHMGSLEHDLERLGRTLDQYPNFYVEMGVRHEAIGCQPWAARNFHIKYQDRILFGQDGALTANQYRQFFRLFETDDDRFSMERGAPPMHGLNLPDEVLRKIYYGNAARLFPKVKEKLLELYPDLKFPEYR